MVNMRLYIPDEAKIARAEVEEVGVQGYRKSAMKIMTHRTCACLFSGNLN